MSFSLEPTYYIFLSLSKIESSKYPNLMMSVVVGETTREDSALCRVK